jgi:hypothetical protein
MDRVQAVVNLAESSYVNIENLLSIFWIENRECIHHRIPQWSGQHKIKIDRPFATARKVPIATSTIFRAL